MTDLVMIDPVGTGYSKPVGKAKGSEFWGVDQDARPQEAEYDAGHMVYVHEASLAKFKQGIGTFIQQTSGGGR